MEISGQYMVALLGLLCRSYPSWYLLTFSREAIEDLTGGVTTELFTTDILDKEKFWEEEIMNVNDQFLFGAATGCFDDWKGGGMYTDRKGVVSRHAYSIMEAREVKGERLLRVRFVKQSYVKIMAS